MWPVVLAVVSLSLVGAGRAAAAPFVYVVDSGTFSEHDVSQFNAPLSSFEALKPLTPATVAAGNTPQGVAVTPDGTSVYVADKNDGTISQYNIDSATGVLTPKSPATVATGSAPLAVAVTRDGKSAYVVNEGDNTVSQYTIDPSTGDLTPKSPATVATGTNPFAVAVTRDGKSAYVVNEGDDTVSQYTIDPSTGDLTPKSPATVAAGMQPDGVAVTPDGKSAYVSNFSFGLAGTVSQYAIDAGTGALSPKSPATVTTGNGPAGVAVTPDDQSAYVTDFLDKTVSQYSIDPGTGLLSPNSPATVATGTDPQAVAVTPDGKSAYVTDTAADTVSQYSIDPGTGTLSPKSPVTVAAGLAPIGVAVAPDADVAVKIGAPASVKSGSRLTYTVTVTNRGPSSAWQVALKDFLPFGTQFRSASSSSGHCTAPKHRRSGGKVTCKLGTITAGNSVKVRIVVNVIASAGQGEITDGASVTSVTPDPHKRNNKNHRRTKVTT